MTNASSDPTLMHELRAELPALSLELAAEVHEFANQLVRTRIVPAKASIDALHIAVAVVNRVDYLVTWNCVHIANAAIRTNIERVCRSAGLQAPVICTPEELMED